MSRDEVSVSLTIRDVSEKDSGSYTLEASNDLGSVSTSGQLDVQGRPKIPEFRMCHTFLLIQRSFSSASENMT